MNGQGAYTNVRLPLLEAETLPRAVYTSQEFYDREIQNIFMKKWKFIGESGSIPNAGDYFTLDYFGIPVVVIRGKDGAIKAYVNSCRHRGAELVSGSGNCKAFVCPYHSWTYTLDGALIGVSEMEKTCKFDKAENGLVPVRLETWGPFIFINMDPDAEDLFSYLGDLPEKFKSHNIDDLVCVRKVTYDIACNWKSMAENAMEDYHVATVHRKSIHEITDEVHEAEEPHGNYASLRGKFKGSFAALGGNTTFPQIETLAGDSTEYTRWVLIYPCDNFVFTSDCVYVSLRWPRGPNQIEYNQLAFFPKATAEREDFEEVVQVYYKRWDTAMAEDKALVEKQHRGVSSKIGVPGRFSYREQLVHELNNWWIDQVLETKA